MPAALAGFASRGMPAAPGWLCFAKPLGLATTARDVPAGTPLPAQRTLVGCGLRPARDIAIDSPGEACPPSRLQCRGWGRLRTFMRSRRRSSHTVTAREAIAPDTSAARLFTLGGVHIRHPLPLITSWHLEANAQTRICFEVPRRTLVLDKAECLHPVGQTGALQRPFVRIGVPAGMSRAVVARPKGFAKQSHPSAAGKARQSARKRSKNRRSQ